MSYICINVYMYKYISIYIYIYATHTTTYDVHTATTRCLGHLRQLLRAAHRTCPYLYLCTSKASEVSSSTSAGTGAHSF